MSRYTTELRYPVEQRLDELMLPHDESSWPKVYGFVGLDDYPIYDESHRQVLNDKVLRRYWMREIGFETFGQFKWNLRRRMHELMPYYNDLYRSAEMITDPMTTKDMTYTERWTRDESTGRTGQGTSKTDSSTSDRNVYQETPMNGLDTGAIEAMDYATNVTFDDGSSSSSGSTTSKSDYTGDFEGTKGHEEKGYDSPQADLVLKYRETIRNIDLEIVDSLNDLFMGVW